MSYILSPQFWPLYAVFFIYLTSLIRIFQKANYSGWLALIPIYNLYIIVKIINRPAWWFILFFIPIVNFYMGMVLVEDICQAFGRGGSSTMAKYYLSIFILPIIAFGSSKYVKPVRY